MNRYADFRILIVDDNRNNLFTLRALIEKHMDVELLEADSGQSALDIALKNPRIDLIILDVQMPDMDGFQTATMLKVRQKTRDIPIIFLTAAYKTDEFQQKGYEVGAADYLLKPIDDNQLINKISTYLRLIEKERDMNRRLEVLVEERTAELRLAKQYLENVINNMGEALLLLEPDGKHQDGQSGRLSHAGLPAGRSAGNGDWRRLRGRGSGAGQCLHGDLAGGIDSNRHHQQYRGLFHCQGPATGTGAVFTDSPQGRGRQDYRYYLYCKGYDRATHVLKRSGTRGGEKHCSQVATHETQSTLPNRLIWSH